MAISSVNGLNGGEVGSVSGCSGSQRFAGQSSSVGLLLMRERIHRACVAQSERHGVFAHGYTYTGHPAACAVALEVLDIYEERDLLGHVRRMAPRLQDGLRQLAGHPLVGDVRGRGMLATVELVVDKERKMPLPKEADAGRRIFDRAWENGLVIRAFAQGVLGYAPPLCCTADEIDRIVVRTRLTLDQTLDDPDVRTAMA